jgi:hypothetical protein
MPCHPLTVITFIGITYNEAAKLGCLAASCRLACRSKRQLGRWPDGAPAEAPRKQEPGAAWGEITVLPHAPTPVAAAAFLITYSKSRCVLFARQCWRGCGP